MRRVTFVNRAPISLLLAISDLPGLDLIRFRYVPAIDDFVAQLDFHGHSLDLHMDWDGDVSLTADQIVPEQMFGQVADHLSTHKIRRFKWPMRLREFERQYRRPAKATWYEKG
jgi:predicted NAD-dependent protein-ADP-ribosyltransferase YbiA (DUF1768 family)